MSYAVFAIPTKEAKIFCNKKPEIVSNVYDAYDDELVELENNFKMSGNYDELISHYVVRKIKI